VRKKKREAKKVAWLVEEIERKERLERRDVITTIYDYVSLYISL
jgi:hypothetical protein